MIERKVIEDLVKLMIEHDLIELDVVDGEQSVTLRRPGSSAPAAAHASAPAAPTPAPAAAQAAAAPAARPEGKTINSPMIGTFYSRSDPDSDPFVTPGARVTETSVVCLVEAMKVFNEVKAECRGVIAEVLVNDGDPVEYGQPLFRVTPA